MLHRSADRAYSYSNAGYMRPRPPFARTPIKTVDPAELLKDSLETLKPVNEQDWDQLKKVVINAQHREMVRDDNIDGMMMVAISRLNRQAGSDPRSLVLSS